MQTSFLCRQLGFSSKFLLGLKLPELTAVPFSSLTDLRISVGWKWLSCGCSTAHTSGGWRSRVNKLGLTVPAPFVYLVMNSYLGLEGCTAALLAMFL